MRPSPNAPALAGESDVMCTSRIANLPGSEERPQQIWLPREHPCAEYGAPGPLHNDLVFPQPRAKCFGQFETVRRQSVESRCLARSAAVPAQRLPCAALIPCATASGDHGSVPPILRHFAPSMEECSGLRVSTCKDSRRAGFEQFEPVALVDNTQLIVFSARQKRQIRHISRIEAHWVHGNEPELASVWYCFQQ